MPVAATQTVQRHRARAADAYRPAYERDLRRVLRTQTKRTAMRVAAGGAVDFLASASSRWAGELARVKRNHIYAMVQAGYAWAGQEFWKPPPSKALNPGPEKPMSATVGEGEEFLITGRFKDIDRWVETTSVSESKTKAKKLEKLFDKASKKRIRITRKVFQPTVGMVSVTYTRGVTPVEIAKQILKGGYASDKARSKMLARTGVIWAFNEGAQQRYRAEGVQVEEWLVTSDDALCPYCAQFDGVRVPIDKSFASAGDRIEAENPSTGKPQALNVKFEVQHPPLHPNCRCSLIPVF